MSAICYPMGDRTIAVLRLRRRQFIEHAFMDCPFPMHSRPATIVPIALDGWAKG